MRFSFSLLVIICVIISVVGQMMLGSDEQAETLDPETRTRIERENQEKIAPMIGMLEQKLRSSLMQGRRSLELSAKLDEVAEITQNLKELMPKLSESTEQNESDVVDEWPDLLKEKHPHLIIDTIAYASAVDLVELMDHMRSLLRTHRPNTRHMSMSITSMGKHLRACVLLYHREVEFSPEVLNDKSDKDVYCECKFCGNKSNNDPVRESGLTLNLCDKCREPTFFVATDNSGGYRYAHEFLTGYAPAAKFPKDMSRKEIIYRVWRTVWEMTTYSWDHKEAVVSRDSWQTARETMDRGTGDCEDSSILLADWLISLGFNARVALGYVWTGHGMGGHAWVVVREEDADYILESTADPGEWPMVLPKTTGDTASQHYWPYLQMDRSGMYCLRRNTAIWARGSSARRSQSFTPYTGNYWGTEWVKMPARERPAYLALPNAKEESKPKKVFFNKTLPDSIMPADKP
jgi:hypothetical protein